MKTTIDQAGRVVIPKTIREQAGLYAGAEIDVHLVNGGVELRPVPGDVQLRREGRFLVAAAPDAVPLTDAEVTGVVEALRAGDPDDERAGDRR